MERAILLNNSAIHHLRCGNFQEAQQQLKEALSIAKHCAFSLQRGTAAPSAAAGTSITKNNNGAAAAAISSGHSMVVHIPGLWDPSFHLCDQAIFLQLPTAVASSRTIFFGEDEENESRKSMRTSPSSPPLMVLEDAAWVGTCSASIIFNTALAFHAYGMQGSPYHPQQRPWLANAQKLYQMSRVIMWEHATANNANHATTTTTTATINLSVRVAATNNLVQIQGRLGQHSQALQRVEELRSLLQTAATAADSRRQTSSQVGQQQYFPPLPPPMDGSIWNSVLKNIVAINANAAPAA